MRKRLMAAGLACVLGGACIFGLAACGNGSGDNGGGTETVAPSAEVNEEGWKAAFKKSTSANVTARNVYNCVNESGGEYEVAVSVKSSETSICSAIEAPQEYWDYMDGAHSREVLKYEYDVKTDNGGYVVSSEDNVQFSVFTELYGNQFEYMKSDLLGFKEFMCITESSGNQESCYAIADAYSVFSYTDGAYRAQLYGFVSETETMQIEVTVKIDNDGYINYFGVQYEKELPVGVMGVREKGVSITLSNYGATEIVIPEGVLAAIEEYTSSNQ